MKIIPSNQTLILANERGGSGGLPSSGVARGLQKIAGDAVLRRVTLLATRPDDTLVFLEADYSAAEPNLPRAASPNTPSDNGVALLTSEATASAAPTRFSSPKPLGRAHRSSRGLDLYTSTQRMPARPPAVLIDEFA